MSTLLNPGSLPGAEPNLSPPVAKRQSVEATTQRADAKSQMGTVNTGTSVNVASEQVMQRESVMEKRNRRWGFWPRYLRHNQWTPESLFLFSTSSWTETATPLPRPSLLDITNIPASSTIFNNPHLFSIVTPINTDRFEELLASHPNPPFVASMIQGLREGFWPWADISREGYPEISDLSKPTPDDPVKADFLRAQRDTEVTRPDVQIGQT